MNRERGKGIAAADAKMDHGSRARIMGSRRSRVNKDRPQRQGHQRVVGFATSHQRVIMMTRVFSLLLTFLCQISICADDLSIGTGLKH